MPNRPSSFVAGSILAAGLLLTAGCAESPRSPVDPLPTTAPPAATPAPAPSLTPEPEPPVTGNRPPTVTITGGGSCHPERRSSVHPCTVTFTAKAKDPDGDRLRYAWEGCATGREESADCVIDKIGTVTATVEVDDRHGNRVTASARAEGVNPPPQNKPTGCFAYCCLSHACSCDNGLPPGQAASCWFEGWDQQPDGDSWGCVRSWAEGACTGGTRPSACGGVGDAIEIDFTTGQGGTCTINVIVRDAWGAESLSSQKATIRAH